MATEMHVEDALERAVIAWIAASGTHSISIGITARQEFEDYTDALTLPSIVVKAERLAEASPSLGNYQYRVTTTLTTQADDTLDATQRQQWHDLVSILMWDTLTTQLTTASLGINANSVQHEDSFPRTEADRHWTQEFVFTVWAYAI